MTANKTNERRSFPLRHLQQHHRFYAGVIAAVAVFAATYGQALPIRSLAAGDAFFIVYLALLVIFAARSTPASTMKHARTEDDGLRLIVLLTLAAVGFSLTAIVTILGSTQTLGSAALIAAVISVPLGWATLHASIALHYARLYYADGRGGSASKELEFPSDEAPDVWDFMYFSFVLGMTTQTSDVQITGRRMRRSVLAHSIISYFYNAVIIALTVNVAVQIAG